MYGTHVYSARDDDDYDCDYEDDEETLSYRDAPWLVDDDSIYDEAIPMEWINVIPKKDWILGLSSTEAKQTK